MSKRRTKCLLDWGENEHCCQSDSFYFFFFLDIFPPKFVSIVAEYKCILAISAIQWSVRSPVDVIKQGRENKFAVTTTITTTNTHIYQRWFVYPNVHKKFQVLPTHTKRKKNIVCLDRHQSSGIFSAFVYYSSVPSVSPKYGSFSCDKFDSAENCFHFVRSHFLFYLNTTISRHTRYNKWEREPHGE